MTATMHCINGHEWTPENTSLDKRGVKCCRACARKRYWANGRQARQARQSQMATQEAMRAQNKPLVATFRAMNDAGVLDEWLMQRLANARKSEEGG